MKEGIDYAYKSKDRNAIHLDSEYCKKSLYGEPIAHGCNALMRIINKKRGRVVEQFGHREIRILYKFHNPIFYDEKHEIDEITISEEHLKFILMSEESKTLKISVDIKIREKMTKAQDSANISSRKNRESVDVMGESLICRILMQSSYIVGMHNPGKNSIYMDGSIECHSDDMFESQKETILLSTTYSKEKGIIRSNSTITDTGIAHSFNALVRPEFREDAESTDGNEESIGVVKAEFGKDVQHIIVGGSSGLGKTLTRILEGYDQEYIYTTRNEETDEKSYFANNLTNLSLNSIRNDSRKEVWIYYFISSRILPDKILTHRQRSELKQTLLDIPIKLIEKLIQDMNEETKKTQTIKFIYPSTSFIDDPIKKQEYKFYTNIKEMAEKKLQKMSGLNQHLKVIVPRLKPLNTRQNMGVTNRNSKYATVNGINMILKAAQNVHD